MCLSLSWIEQMLIWIVMLAVIIGVLQILVPWVCGMMGISLGPIMPIIRLIVIGIVVIGVIIFVFSLLQCMGGLHLPRPG